MTKNRYEQVKRLTSYLAEEYEGFIGVPSEMILVETGVKRPKDLPSWLKPINTQDKSFRFYAFEDVALIACDLNEQHFCEIVK